MIDCLLIGHNDSNFNEYERMIREMGIKSGAYRDLNLNFFEYDQEPVRAMDILNLFHFQQQGKEGESFYTGEYLGLTIAYLASFIARHGFGFDYINAFHREKEKLREKLLSGNILTVAITTTLYVSTPPLREVIGFIREYNDRVKIIVGGPFILNQVQEGGEGTLSYVFEYLGADIYVCSHEGEATLVQVLQGLKENSDLSGIPNLVYKVGSHYVKTGAYLENNRLEENRVDWRLFPARDVGPFVSLRTAKSCPFSCAFCGFPQRAGRYRFLEEKDVEKQLQDLAELGFVRSLSFIDDTFNIPRERFKNILRLMINRGFSFGWNSYFRCQDIDEETVALMKASGCEGVYLGIESGSNRILQNMNKKAKREAYLQGIKLLRQYDIMTHASFIIGFPGETDETVQETLDFIEEAAPAFYRTQLWYYDPITPVHQEKDKYRIRGSSFEWSHLTMDSQQAADWIEKIFNRVDRSLWLPQNSFDYVALYYLRQKGMAPERIKNFIKTFNDIVKLKFTPPEDIDEFAIFRLVDELRETCEF